jgi:hypothetical protein
LFLPLPGGTNVTLPSWPSLKTTLRTRNWPLAQLFAPRCGFQGPIGPLAYYFPSLTALDLSSNQLTGVVPSDLGAGKMFYLGLGGNRLRGGREMRAGVLEGLRARLGLRKGGPKSPTPETSLHASLCLASAGTLPTGLAAGFSTVAGSSNYLDVSGNQLSGQLPSSWGTSGVTFHSASFRGNYLSGAIPSSWSALMLAVRRLDLGSNNLTGSLPSALTSSTNPSALATPSPGPRFAYRAGVAPVDSQRIGVLLVSQAERPIPADYPSITVCLHPP